VPVNRLVVGSNPTTAINHKEEKSTGLFKLVQLHFLGAANFSLILSFHTVLHIF
jgi:hypothetical protein